MSLLSNSICQNHTNQWVGAVPGSCLGQSYKGNTMPVSRSDALLHMCSLHTGHQYHLVGGLMIFRASSHPEVCRQSEPTLGRRNGHQELEGTWNIVRKEILVTTSSLRCPGTGHCQPQQVPAADGRFGNFQEALPSP